MIKDLSVNETNKTKDYFIDEIRERELMSKRLSKYIPSFDYFDKSLIFYMQYQVQVSVFHFQ